MKPKQNFVPHYKELPYKELPKEQQQLAVTANLSTIDKDYDEGFLKFLNRHINPYVKIYFRPKLIGFDEVISRHDRESPVIYACNHSGMAFPCDAVVFASEMNDKHGYQADKLFRFIVSPALFSSRLMSPFLLDGFWGKAGCIKASTLNFDTLMKNEKTNVFNFPEGIPGIGKGFGKRYQLQPFSSSMVRMAIKHNTEIIGISCVNGEYINPYAYSNDFVNRWVQKIGVPYLPLGWHSLLLPFCPWLFYSTMPAKLVYVKGNTYKPSEMLDGKNADDISDADVELIRDKIHQDMQIELDKSVAEHGKKPYDWKELWAYFKLHWKTFPIWTPLGFPLLMTDRYHCYINKKEPDIEINNAVSYFFRVIKRHPFVLNFYIPILGWIPILYRGLKGRNKSIKERWSALKRR